MRRSFAGCCAILGALAFPAPVLAAGCDSVTVLPLLPTGSQFLVEAQLNGAPQPMAVDIGARTMVSRLVVDRLHLPPDPHHNGAVHGFVWAGDVQPDALLRSLTLGDIALPAPHVLVNNAELPRGIAGLLGSDLLYAPAHDLELDFPGRHLALHPGGACATGPLGWSGRYWPLPISKTATSHHLLVPVTLNGVTLRAVLDTGAFATSISRSAARRAGISDELQDGAPIIPTRDVNGTGTVAHRFRFESFTVGPERFRNVELVVADGDFSDGDLLLGMDYFRGRKLWLSAATAQLYVMPPVHATKTAPLP